MGNRTFQVILRTLLLGGCLAALAACGDATSPPRPQTVEVVAGDAQTDTVGATLGTALRIRVLDERGRPLDNYAVSWAVAAGDAVVTPATPVTDALGEVAATVTLGTAAGDVRVAASIGTKHTMVFTATAAAGLPKSASASVNTIAFAALGDTTRIELVVKDRAGNAIDTARVTWTSSDPAVVKVPAAGVAVSLTPGSATVTASITNGPAVQLPATVSQEIAAVQIAAGTRTFTALGDTLSLSAHALDRNAFEVVGAKLKWSTSDSLVVQVDSTGLVRSTGPGTASVTVRSSSATASTPFSVIQDTKEIAIAPDSITLEAFADTAHAEATARDRNGYLIEAAEFAWTVSDTAIAVVDADGVVTARSNGTAELHATYDGVTQTIGVRIRQKAAAVIVAPEEQTLHALADTALFTAQAFDANEFEILDPVFTWTSANATIASVDTVGRAVSGAPGETEIRASMDGAVGAGTLIIDQIPATVTVTPVAVTLSALEDTAQLTAVAFDSTGHEIEDATFTWSVANSSIAAVNSKGIVTGQTPGTTVVTAKAEDAKGESTVTVRQTAARVTLAPADVTLTAVGETEQLRATAYDANGNVIDDAAFTWSVTDASVASISSTGLVTSKRGGQTTVRVKSGNAQDDGIVRVVQQADILTLEAPDDTLRDGGDKIQLVAKAWDRNGYEVSGREFTWRSLKTSSVFVNSSGVVRASDTRGDARVVASLDGVADTVVVTYMPYGILVLTFDDAWADVYTRVLPLLKQYGIKANIALPKSFVGQPGRLTLTQIKNIYAQGWSVVPHGVSHEPLTTLNRPAMEQELDESKAYIEDNNLGPSSVFIVPWHRWFEREENEIRKRYDAARGWGITHESHGGMVDWPAADMYELTAIPADDHFRTAEGRAKMAAWWLEAVQNGKFVETYFHDVDSTEYAAFVATIELLLKHREHLRTWAQVMDN